MNPDIVGAAIMRPSDPNPTVIGINRFHRAYSHAASEPILRNTSGKNKRNSHWYPITLFGMSWKGFKRPVQQSTKTRARESLTRVFVDLTGPKRTRARDGSYYTMIVKDDYSRRTWLYFLNTRTKLTLPSGAFSVT